MSQSEGTQKADDQTSKEFLGLKEFFSILVKVVSALAGFAALFVLLGYTIILSFINNVKLYGLTSFPQEFYKEATMKFVGDMFESYGRHQVCTAIMVILIAVTIFVLMKYKETVSLKVIGFVVSLFILLITLITLNPEGLPGKVFSGAIKNVLSITNEEETRRILLFMISVPVLLGVFVYLALKFKDFVKKPYRFYSLMILLFLCLFISIPVGYGNNIFDIDIYPVVGFDYADGIQIESLKNLKKDIDTQGKGTLFYLMGHTMDREIFFDNQSLVKMVLVERNLIKFLKVSKWETEEPQTVRNILRKPESLFIAQKLEGGEALPDKIKKLIERETR